MSCECPTSPNPACAPFPNDNGDNPSTMTKKPVKKTCYRMTMGCSDIQWGPLDEHGNRSGKCVGAPLDTPQEIPCADIPKTTEGDRK